MSDDFDLIAEIREDQGKGASRRPVSYTHLTLPTITE